MRSDFPKVILRLHWWIDLSAFICYLKIFQFLCIVALNVFANSDLFVDQFSQINCPALPIWHVNLIPVGPSLAWNHFPSALLITIIFFLRIVCVLIFALPSTLYILSWRRLGHIADICTVRIVLLFFIRASKIGLLRPRIARIIFQLGRRSLLLSYTHLLLILSVPFPGSLDDVFLLIRCLQLCLIRVFQNVSGLRELDLSALIWTWARTAHAFIEFLYRRRGSLFSFSLQSKVALVPLLQSLPLSFIICQM